VRHASGRVQGTYFPTAAVTGGERINGLHPPTLAPPPIPPPFPRTTPALTPLRPRRFGRIAGLLALVAVGAIGAKLIPPPAARDDGITGTAAARSWIAGRLLDPDSARFDDVVSRRVDFNGYSLWLVCGMVNGRNRFGGYAGAQPFYVWISMIGNEPEGALNPRRLPPECSRRPTQAAAL